MKPLASGLSGWPHGCPFAVKTSPVRATQAAFTGADTEGNNTERECVGGPGDDDQGDLPQLW